MLNRHRPLLRASNSSERDLRRFDPFFGAATESPLLTKHAVCGNYDFGTTIRERSGLSVERRPLLLVDDLSKGGIGRFSQTRGAFRPSDASSPAMCVVAYATLQVNSGVKTLALYRKRQGATRLKECSSR
jgi:hypothetical protein